MLYTIKPPPVDYRGYDGKKYSKLPFLLAVCCAILSALIKLLATGMAFAAFFSICLAGAFLIYGVIGILAVKIQAFRIVRLIIHILFLVWLLSFIIVELFIIAGMKSDADSADYVIVLGAGLYGETPSLALLGRMEIAEIYLKEHENAVAIVSGGQGPGEYITEAEAMRRYLTAQGIEPSRIIMEDKSRNTDENLKFSGDIIKELHGVDEPIKICIISSDFHLFRSRLLAKRYGFEPVAIGSRMPLIWTQATYMLREYFSVINALIKP